MIGSAVDNTIECDHNSIPHFALFYYAKGFCVIPAEYGSNRPIIAWERFQKERPSREQVAQWFICHSTTEPTPPL